MAKKRGKARPEPTPETERPDPDPVDPTGDEPAAPSMSEVFLPKALRESRAMKWWKSLPVERRQLLLVIGIAAAIFVPFLGSVGLWDPWETHYAEVARSMVVRGDYIHPYWEWAYFFSKPVLSMWLMAIGMRLVHSMHTPGGPLSIYTEWAVRMPFALLAIWGAVAVYLAAARIWTRRVGLIAAFALSTMPFYFLIARQAMTDMPLVSLMSGALACFMIAVFTREDHDAAPRVPWLYAFYILMGFATLAKGLLGFMLPGAIILAFLVVSGEWHLLKKLRIPTGILVFLGVAAPWYTAMTLFDGKDWEFKTWFQRFIIHDHFDRIAEGVHTTTPNTSFVYFVRELGFGMFPWVAAVPGALGLISRPKTARSKALPDQAKIFVLLWLLVAFILFTLGATKFHHYAFPMVPPLAILCALYLDTLWEEGPDRNLVLLLLGLVLYIVVAQNLVLEPKHLVNLYVYKYDRLYPSREVDPRALFATAFSVAGLMLFAGFLWRSRRILFGTFFGLAAAFAIYTSWVHWVALSPHWSQRDIFWTYYHDRKDHEPIAAYYMNWRGETFYSQNTVHQIKDPATLRKFVERPGSEYVVVERHRYEGMRSVLGFHYRCHILDRSNNKFYLVRVDPAPPR